MAASILLTMVTVGCGGGGSSPTNPTPPPPQAGITFTPAGGAGANSVTLRRGAASTSSVLFLEVVATDVADLYGVSFDIMFPANVLDYESAVEGGFLADGGLFGTSLQSSEATPGNLVVGVTRLGAVPGADGSGILMTLRFRAIGTGGGSVVFDRQEAYDNGGTPQAGVSWSGGSVQVVI